MASPWELIVAAGALTALTAPVAATLARRWDIVDRPGPLKVQAAPVPYLGGVAVFIGITAALLLAGHALLALPLAMALALGTADDRFGLAVGVRLGAQVGIGGVVAATVDSDLPGPLLVPLAVGLTVVLVNALNLIDGLDGLATGVAAMSALGLAVVLPEGGQVLALATTAAAAGFLLHNRPPARQYLGDGGAYLLGTALAVAMLSTTGPGLDGSVLVAGPLFIAYPAIEVVATVLRRRRAGLTWSAGDRGHSYDRLVAGGLSVPRVVLLVVLVQGMATGVGVALAGAPLWVAAAGVVVATAVAAAAVHRADLLGPEPGSA